MKIFIGYDQREVAAYHVLAESIISRASRPVSITPLVQDQLRASGLYKRPANDPASTAFTYTRFLVPALCDYRGFALFLDCDILCRTDVHELDLYHLAYPGRSVYVAQHDYVPREGTKFLGERQVPYPKKNWSSVMLFDCSRCKSLTVDAVNTKDGAWLHRFDWLEPSAIGSLPLDWNWLVGEYEPNPDAKMLHYTLGGPWFDPATDHAEDWLAESARLRS